MLDWLSIRFTLTDGHRVRVWGLPESFLSARGSRGHELVQRLGAIVERRNDQPGTAERYGRRRTVDWWFVLVLLTLFGAPSYLGGGR